MNKLFTLFLLLFALLANNSFAQKDFSTESTPEERAELLTDYMVESLSLPDSSQIAEIHSINLEYARKNEAVINSNDRKLSKWKKLKAYGESKDKELKKVLSSAQFSAYQKNKQEMQQRMKERIKERRTEGN